MRRFLPALIALALAAPAQGDILWFKNGRSMEGKVTELEDGRVQIEMSFGTMAFEADKIDRVEKALTLEEIVEHALADLGPEDTESLLELAAWCRDRNAHTLANRVLATLLEFQPDNEEARQRLGHVRVGDRWLTEPAARAAAGQVRVGGEWMSARERDDRMLLARDQRRQERRQRLEEAALELEAARLELEVERLRRDSDSDVEPGIPLDWVWIPTDGHLHTPGYSGQGIAGPHRGGHRQPSAEAPQQRSSSRSRAPARPPRSGRHTSGTITPPK